MDDLSVLMVSPDAASYLCRIEFNVSQLNSSDPMKNIVSSAKRRWLTRGDPLAILIPITGLLVALSYTTQIGPHYTV